MVEPRFLWVRREQERRSSSSPDSPRPREIAVAHLHPAKENGELTQVWGRRGSHPPIKVEAFSNRRHFAREFDSSLHPCKGRLPSSCRLRFAMRGNTGVRAPPAASKVPSSRPVSCLSRPACRATHTWRTFRSCRSRLTEHRDPAPTPQTGSGSLRTNGTPAAWYQQRPLVSSIRITVHIVQGSSRSQRLRRFYPTNTPLSLLLTRMPIGPM
jgi:hypothetical protein